MFNGNECYRRYLSGEEHAFDELMDAYHDSLILFINKYICNYSVAEELAADCFVELIVHKKRFLGNSDFKTYLYSIGRHKAIDFIRKDSKKKTLPSDELPEIEDDEHVETAFIENEEKRNLHAAISRLSEDYRSVVYLIFFEELSYEAAAKVLGKSKKQIDNLIYRAKSALKKILAEGDGANAQQ
ncbi:MAG: RNA polymerase sigma factor [Clostridia bacterium]|nr:RNA polymerase sigma factor [Clostridia bacterium]